MTFRLEETVLKMLPWRKADVESPHAVPSCRTSVTAGVDVEVTSKITTTLPDRTAMTRTLAAGMARKFATSASNDATKSWRVEENSEPTCSMSMEISARYGAVVAPSFGLGVGAGVVAGFSID